MSINFWRFDGGTGRVVGRQVRRWWPLARPMGQRRVRRRGARWSYPELLESRQMLAASSLVPCLLDAPPPEEAEMAPQVREPSSGTTDETATAGTLAAAAAIAAEDATFGSDEAAVDQLIDDALQRYAHLFGQSFATVMPFDPFRAGGGAAEPVVLIGTPPDEVSLNSPNGELTTLHVGPYATNTQVAGVDEADLMEFDGRYLYTVSDDQLTIVDVEQPGELSIVARTSLVGQSRSIYLVGDRLVVLSTQAGGQLGGDMMLPYWSEPVRGETWITTFDVQDPTQPLQIDQIKMDGTTVESRMMGSTLFLVSTSEWVLPPPKFIAVDDPSDGIVEDHSSHGQVVPLDIYHPAYLPPTHGRYETAEEYVARVRPDALQRTVPGWSYGSQAADSSEMQPLLVDPAQIMRPADPWDSTLVTVSSWDVSADRLTTADTQAQVISNVSAVYMDAQRLVLAEQTWTDTTFDTESTADDPALNIVVRHVVPQVATGLTSIAIEPASGQLQWEAAGEVPGRLIDRFALDSQENVLRVATTEQEALDGDASNRLETLQLQGDRWLLLGSVAGWAEGETIRSVRFAGDRAYIVTFPLAQPTIQLADPLFVIDLRDDSNPVVMGELIVSGYSSYLQVLDEDHVLGIGREVDPDTGLDVGFQLSLYDTSDPSAPHIVDRFWREGWASSEAEFDLHAVTYDPASGLLVVPIWTTPQELVWDTTWVNADIEKQPRLLPGMWMGHGPQHQLHVFAVDFVEGLELVGTASMQGAGGRSILHDDQLVARTDHVVATFDLQNLGEPLDEVVLASRAERDQFSVIVSAEPVRLDVLTNDVAADGTTLTIVAVNDPNESLTIADDGSHLLLDTRRLTLVGDNSMESGVYVSSTYTIRDSYGVERSAAIGIYVEQLVTAASDTYWIINDGEPHVLSVLENDTGLSESSVLLISDIEANDYHGTIEIAADQKSLLYTPAPGFIGIESIVYTATDEAGNVGKGIATVNIGDPHPAGEAQVAFAVEIVGLNGQATSSVVAGEEVWVDIYVQDLRPVGHGVFSAYVDVGFSGVPVQLHPTLERGPHFQNGQRGTVQGNQIDELGGMGGLSAPGGARQLLARIAVTPQQSGTLRIRLDAADHVESDVTLHGYNYEMSPAQARFGTTEANVVAAVFGDVNGDGVVAPLDALLIINELHHDHIFAESEVGVENATESGMPLLSWGMPIFGSDMSESMATRLQERWRARHDIDDNGVISPLDALLVINRLLP